MAIPRYFGHIEIEKQLGFLRIVETAPFGVVDINGAFLEHDIAGQFDTA